MTHVFIITTSAASRSTAEMIARDLGQDAHSPEIIDIKEFGAKQFEAARLLVFVGAMGICVRAIGPLMRSKLTDPAVVCVDSLGRHAVAVISGHVGGANDYTRRIASALGAEPVITTQSDVAGGWALDTLGRQMGWGVELHGITMRQAVYGMVNGEPVAFVAEVQTPQVDELRRTMGPNVREYASIDAVPPGECRMLVAVTPRIFVPALPAVFFRPHVLALGMGCRKDCPSDSGSVDSVISMLKGIGYSPDSVACVATAGIKKNEPLVLAVGAALGAPVVAYESDRLASVEVPNPSGRVLEATGSPSVAEAASILASDGGPLLACKTKGRTSAGCECCDFTLAVAMQRVAAKGMGHVEIVGAGPGDPELVSVRGRRFLENADLILYAGSLVPRALTECAKPGATVRSSAGMTLEEQIELMHRHYLRGHLIVRLHTGDPCIYGAIQEQMAEMDRLGMHYHITPGISSFQAAAAELKSQFTIPERVQSIILTRGEGRTPMPEREQLNRLAQSRSTMCIYLSADIVERVQEQLLEAYPPSTPVAVCHKLTWPEQEIFRGELSQLTELVRGNNLTLTTMIVVGDAIGNRSGLSKLYSSHFSHIFRK